MHPTPVEGPDGGAAAAAPRFGEAVGVWLKIGLISFGGPAGQIAILHEELVERRRWISERRFLHALNYCMVLPGPEAQQLATYIGWLMHRTWGGVVAGALFVLPSLVILISLSWLYMAYGHVPAIAGILLIKIGEGGCFLLNGISYIAVIIGLLMMKVECRARSKSDSPLEDIIEGFRWVSNTGPIRALLLLLGLVSLVGMPYTVLMPIFADHVLHSGAKGLGILMGFTGIGALLGALTLAVRTGVRGLGRLISICCAGFGVSLIAFSFSKLFWLSASLLIPVGFFIMLQMACSNTLIQAMVPDALRGRVMALIP
jgi:hypothetical protein